MPFLKCILQSILYKYELNNHIEIHVTFLANCHDSALKHEERWMTVMYLLSDVTEKLIMAQTCLKAY